MSEVVSEKEYFIYLLSCHLNGTTPKGEKDIDWNLVYEFAKRHSVVAMIAKVIKKLPKEFLPDEKTFSIFDKELESTNQKYEFKMKTLFTFITALTNAKISHLLIKGSVLRNIYPSPELRVSSDTDVIVKPTEFFDAIDVLKDKGFNVDLVENSVATIKCGSETFELNTELENINIQSKIYFSTPFDDISECSGYTYKLKPIYHLLYVITHIAHHLSIGGVGIRMIMDIDAIIRNYPEINIRKFLELCDNIKIRKTAEALIALSKKWFKTPVAIGFTFEDKENEKLFEDFSNIIIERESAKDYFDKEKQNNKKANKFKLLFKGAKNSSNNEDSSQMKIDILEELEMN